MLIRIREFRNGPRGRWLLEQLVGVFVALLIVAGLTASLAAAFLWLPIEHVTIVYLIPVIIAALRWGAIPALFAGISGIGAAAFFSTRRITTSVFTVPPRSPTSCCS